MRKCKWARTLPIFLLVLVFSSTSLLAGELYLYDESVASEIDVGEYLATGNVVKANGLGFFKWVDKGPAPDPYPTIMIPEKDFENLGESNVEIDGLVFINHGRNLVKNKKAMVLWTIRIPRADIRRAAEFAEDLTMSMWIDWNQDQMWRKDERTLIRHVNVLEHLPAATADAAWPGDEDIYIHYLASFVVPDITELPGSNPSNAKRLDLWARACLAYDDPDMSPDGSQLFGEYEDYKLSYLVTPNSGKRDRQR